MFERPFAEYVRHRLIDTPLEPFLTRGRKAQAWLKALRTPDLMTVYVQEPAAIEAMFARDVHDGMNCVDVGAHIGSVTAALRRLSPSGKHIAVEPTPYKAKWLRAKYADVEVVECALSDAPGRATFYHQAAASGYSGLRAAKAKGEPTAFEVEVRRLDDVVPADRRIGLLKVDVEGGELDVFRGAVRILERDRPTILFECTLSGLESFGQTSRQVHQFLSGRGYELFTPVDRLHNVPALDEGRFDRATRYPFHAFNFIAVPSLGPAAEREPLVRIA